MDHKSEKEEECPDSGKKDSCQIITEGKAEVLLSSSKSVFYNPVQEFNRDLRYILQRVVIT
jgi:tRNA G26 N,N-dimethylase Trm1